MRGLTLWQPYASLVAIGAKRIETRGWLTAYRGPLLIHAAKRWDGDLEDECRWAAEELRKEGWPGGPTALLPWRDTLGRVLCVADLVRCERSVREEDYPRLDRIFGDLSPGRAAWHLRNVRPLVPPVPCPGARSLWHVPDGLLAAVGAPPGTAPTQRDLFE